MRDIGKFDGEILVFSDKPVEYRGVSNIVLPIRTLTSR
jgi:hypothetical protein